MAQAAVSETEYESKTPSKFTGFAAKEAGIKFESFEYEPQALGDNDVEVRVTHNGCCGSDLSMLRNHWGFSSYPIIVGHEVVGNITQCGKNVTKFVKGDRVGLGWFKDSCGDCKFCICGKTNLCKTAQATIIGNYGGMCDYIRASSRFVFQIPDSLDSCYAAPLLCAGATVYNAITQHIDGPGDKIGILGIGGLGHLAIKFGKALGCYVTAFSSSNKKEEEAMNEFGASSYVLTSNEDEMKKLVGSFDLILVTAAVKLDYNFYLSLLNNGGTLCFVGGTMDLLNVPNSSVMGSCEKRITGGAGAGVAKLQEMLNFAAVNKIYPKIETLPLSKASEAFEKLEKSQVRYRMVLVTDEKDLK